jgi:hypothetical protein
MAILNNPPTTETRVIHVSEMDRFPDAVYIGRAMPRQRLRGSKWANPYKIGSTDYANERGDDYHAPLSRMDVIDRYRRRILGKPELLNALPELRGKPLACWCRRDGEAKSPHNLCHGDVLIELLNRTDDIQMQRSAAFKVILDAEWKLRQKPLSTIQRFVARMDKTLGIEQGDEWGGIPSVIGRHALDLIRLANRHGVSLSDVLTDCIKLELESQYGALADVNSDLMRARDWAESEAAS